MRSKDEKTKPDPKTHYSQYMLVHKIKPIKTKTMMNQFKSLNIVLGHYTKMMNSPTNTVYRALDYSTTSIVNKAPMKQYNRSFVTAVQNTKHQDLKELKAEPRVSSITSPSVSNFIHKVDEIFGNDPFFRANDVSSHFWNQMGTIGDIMRMKKEFLSNKLIFPRYDILSDEDKVQLVIYVPGMSLKDIDVNVEDDKILHISGHHKTMDGGATSDLNFEEKFNFGKIDSSKIVASLANGILRVSLPKLPAAERDLENVKKIDVVDGSGEIDD